MKNHLRKIEIIGGAFGVVVGTLLHFTYQWSGKNFVVGIFSTVNESVWEHTKLVFFPILLFGIIEFFLLRGRVKNFFCAKAAEAFITVIFLIVFFYTYTGALGVESLIVDILSFVVAVILGKWLSYKILSRENVAKIRAREALAGIFLFPLLAFFIFVLLYPVRVPLFLDPVEGVYTIFQIK